MATFGNIIFYTMITLIVIFSSLLILILALTLSVSTGQVESNDIFPVANLGEDRLLSCFLSKQEPTLLSQLSITWTKEGLSGQVYKYESGVLQLQDQNAQFKGRTALFPKAIAVGNASLLLRNVRSADEGQYTCSISASSGKGTISIHLRTAAYSAPQFTFTNGSLIAEAKRWRPKPEVTWFDLDGTALTSSTTFSSNSGGVFTVASTLRPAFSNQSYTCRIENSLVTAVSEAFFTASGVLGRVFFTFSAASHLLASPHLSMMTSILCICYHYLT
ncbi:hypothetical protein LDENG_00063770 [Lucifuga dentata]|nr:hypothetical protein LDENG_00063770 [Lucifuga dentata]